MKLSKKILLLTSATALSFAGWTLFYCSLTGKMVKVAVDRNKTIPKGISNGKISGSIFNEFESHIQKASEKLRSMDTKLIEIVASDGEKLAGHLLEHKSPKRIILAMHGWRSDWSRDFGPITDFWNYNNCTVLYADQRGHGQSGGSYIGFGLTERYDCLDWVNWINKNINTNNLPIYLAGISMGATTVLMASDLELPDNVHGIMADCGFTSPYEIWKHVANNNLGISYSMVSYLANSMYRKRTDMNTDDYSTVEALENTKIPVLLIHGSDDTFVPVEMTYSNYKACTSPKKLLIVPGAKHALSYYVNRLEYEETVKKFWKMCDNRNI